ncbi:CRISPR-associated endonuclease Cas1 [Methanofollis aquaemaris]|uniref:CRISPR-associated endonuclease Cas1 n=1 Tax=Methanofollis aquaemaris TaxID=126734 RepID=A0A8A3S8J9_9EURY|nr:CRISPR-associated endonuclease Cas1 [Methanofollis aquaemaris]QSZ68021.1 CRISPR-associated endonuclease Cas1 [Methanofollis aquaemaris]
MTEKARAWVTVAGFGGHIKATRTTLTVRKKNEERQYDIRDVGHLIVVGGHTIHTSAVISLLRAGAFISIFDADGQPAGQLTPPGMGDAATALRSAQNRAFGHTYALAFAEKAMNERLLAIERYGNASGWDLLYEGELEFLHRSREEYPFLIKMDELRRLHQMSTDMYYEVMGRTLPGGLEFQRRTKRPHPDPVNAMLSFGYAVLYSAANVAVIAAGLDPDHGVFKEGPGGLVYDVIDGFKPTMVDDPVFALARAGLGRGEYETGIGRCVLSECLATRLLSVLHRTIREERVTAVVRDLAHSLKTGENFSPVY